MNLGGIVRTIVGLFTKDLARKVLALVFALVLFEVLDKQVQADGTLTLPIEYVNESDLSQAADRSEGRSLLLIAERGGTGKPLIVANYPIRELTLALHASKDSIERAKTRRHRFVWRLGREGVLTPTAEEFEGMEAFLQELGPGARVEVSPRVSLNIEVEDTVTLSLAESDLVFDGSPPPGYDLNPSKVNWRPREIQLVGPHTLVDTAQHRRLELFEKFKLDGRSDKLTQPLHLNDAWSRLRMLDGKGVELDAVNVSVEFSRKMVALTSAEGRFDLPVRVVYNDDRLHQLVEGKSERDGWRLEFAKAVNGEVRVTLQILVPDTQVTGVGVDRVRIDAARTNVQLIVLAHEAIVDRTVVPIHIVRFEDFPEGLDVVFADGQSDQIQVQWKKPESAAHPSDDKDKKAGNGDH